tara:strand:+ start:147 stop:563 length:417 start_codon:yes stop_codon:yes gene_type:complete
MAEWSIALPWKGSNWVTGSGVRIPVSPPFIDDSELSVNITLMNSKYIQQLSNILQMLENIDHDLNLVGYNETEKKIFYTIANNIHTNKKCNITNVIESSGFSRSTVYKAIKKFEDQGLVSLMQSNDDKREVYLDLLLA